MGNNQTRKFVHETELLLSCAHSRCDSQTSEKIRALCQEHLDWPYLIRLSFRHGVMPLLYRSLMHACPEAVPKATLEKLRSDFQVNACHNHFLAEELIKLLDLLKAEGIVAIPFKGPELAVRAYGDLLLRQFGDLDILVQKSDLIKVKGLLLRQGYQSYLTSSQEEYFLKHRYHHAFLQADGKFLVEIHWAFTRKYWQFRLGWEELWERAESRSLDGQTLLTFHPEDLLVLLCVHGAKHAWPRLEWICDIAELIRVHRNIDWDHIITRARSLGIERVVCVGLLLASRLLGTALPGPILHRIQAQEVVGALTTEFEQRLFPEMNPQHEPTSSDAMYLRMRERVRDKIFYILYHLSQRLEEAITPNTRDLAFLPLPTSLSFLYYALRPIRLFRDYGWRYLKHLVRV